MWLTRLALRNPILILMMSLMVIALGAVALDKLAVDLFPDITIPVIRVATFYTGAAPADIEKSITQPIERAVAAAPGVDRVESNSKQGVSVVSVWFAYDTNLDNAQFEVSQRVAAILNTLPPGIQQPFVTKFDITNIPVAQIAIGSDSMDEKQLYDLAYNVIEPQFERIQGVASASVGGGKQREIEVRVDPDLARARGIGLLDIMNAVRTSNLLLPSGDIRAGDLDYNVFTNTQVQDARPLRDVIVRPAANGPVQLQGQAAPSVRVADVASVDDTSSDQGDIVKINGARGVYMRVLKQPGGNTIQVVDALKASMHDLRGVPPNVHVDMAFDQSSYIRAAVRALQHEAITGGLLAVAVILFFLASLRATAIVSVAIPLSVVATFVLLYFFRQSLNVFTLGGLALGIGRLVDDSIVELENIHRHLQQPGTTRREAVLAAAKEVAMPIFVSTVTTVIVFFPVLFLTGVAKNLFVPLAMTIAFALIMSFFVSRTVTPLLCLFVLRAHEQHEGQMKGVPGWITRRLDALDHAYARALTFVLHHRFPVIGLIFACFVASLFLVKRIGTEFFPDADESQFQVFYRAPIGTRVERSLEVTERIEEIIRRDLTIDGKPIYRTMLSDTGLPLGRTALYTANTGPHSGNVNINLVSPSQRRIKDVEAAEKVRASLREGFPGTQIFFFTGGIVKRILTFGAPAPIDVEILGFDLDGATAYAKQILPQMKALADSDGKPLLTDVQITREENYPELDVVVDREKAGSLGLNVQQIAQTVLTSLVGSTQLSPIPFTDPKTGNEYFINVRLDDRHRSHLTDVSELFLRAPSGAMIPLDNVARVQRSSGPVLIGRKYLQRIVEVTANIAPGKDLGKAGAGTQKILDDTRPPDGFTVQLGGQTQAQKQAFAGLGFAGLMALALVYMVLASQFRSLLDPLVIMFSVPLGVSGVFLMLWSTGTTLSVNSAMGIIMMIGIVVSNGVLLVDFANVLRSRGKPLVEATVEAARTRLRPILMTTIATVFGLLPMAAGLGEGSETNLPLARAVIGGLSVSTVFTLFLIPSLYTLIDRFSRRKFRQEEEEAV